MEEKNLESPCPPGQRGGEPEFAERKIVIYFISVEKCSVFSFLFIFFLAFGLHDKWVLKSGAIEEGPRGATKKIAKKDAWKYISLLMPLFILPNLLPVPHVEPSSSLMRAINWRERCWRKNHAPEKKTVSRVAGGGKQLRNNDVGALTKSHLSHFFCWGRKRN